MRGHFQYLRFKTFPMTPRTPQCKVFCPLLSSSKHSEVPEDSQPPTFPSVGLHPHTWPKWGCDNQPNPPPVNNLPPPIVNPPPPPNPIIDPMMLPRGLPIIIPQGLMPVTVPVNLPKFTRTRNEDPAAHVERFVEVLITSLVTNPNYYLVWFPTTLDDSAYAWYRSHNVGTFASWQELQAAFLRQFRPEVGQQNALMALSNIRQGADEDITSYVRRFRVVCTRFVGQMLTYDTIRHYFIQGFNKNSTIRDILNRRPTTLNDAITTALEVEIINRENERMWRREENPIPKFIPLYHRPVESQIKLQPKLLVMKPPIQTVLTPMPLAIMPPSESSGTNPPLMETQFEEFRSELKETNEGFKDRCRNPDKVIPLNPPPGNYQQQARNNVQEIKENKGRITLEAPTLAVTTRAKTLAMPILKESSDVPSEDSPHFSELDEVLKEARKNVKKAKAKGNEPPPLELNDDEVFQFVRDERLGSGMTHVPRVIHA
ncbi:hypothetical protein CY35_17G086200 [Sphagnum magellanicum]|nr:hypothetical protein CY35_17G086200 [Sphagnum magellanicum]